MSSAMEASNHLPEEEPDLVGRSQNGTSKRKNLRKSFMFQSSVYFPSDEETQRRTNAHQEDRLSGLEESSHDDSSTFPGMKVHIPNEDSATKRGDKTVSALSWENALQDRRLLFCFFLAIALLVAGICLAVTCGLGYCEGQSALQDAEVLAPAPSPTRPPIGPTGTIQVITTEALYDIVDLYFDGQIETIRTLNVSALTNFTSVFDAQRNPKAAFFNAALSWSTPNAKTMDFMFRGAKNFNQDVWFDTAKVNSMRGMFAAAVSFDGRVDFSTSSLVAAEGMFEGAASFTGKGIEGWPTGRIVNMSSMFRGAHSFNANLERWNTVRTKYMGDTFADCLSYLGRGLNTWDTSLVEDMSGMFRNTPSFNGNLERWNVSKVRSMKDMFRGSGFNGDASDWDTSSVNTMSGMFRHAVLFSADASNWNVGNVVDMSDMFAGASSFEGSDKLCDWTEKLPTDEGVLARSMFLKSDCEYQEDPNPADFASSPFCHGECGAGSQTQPTDPGQEVVGFLRKFQTIEELYEAVDKYLDIDDSPGRAFVAFTYGYPIDKWDVSLVTNFTSVFDANRNPLARNFTESIGSWNVSSATTMERMFAGASRYDRDLSRWSVENVVSMKSMFKDAHNFRGGDLSSWNTTSCTDMTSMFEGADRFDGDLSGFVTESVRTLRNMFRKALSFTGRGLQTWNTVNVEDLHGTFQECLSLRGFVSLWSVGNVRDLSSTFRHAGDLWNEDIEDWDVSSVESFAYTFAGARLFNKDLASWQMTSATDLTGMFAGARAFNQYLCSWRRNVGNDEAITLGVFAASGCRVTDDPVSVDSGPWCFTCPDS